MKIGLIHPCKLADQDGDERTWTSLADRLTDRGHETERLVLDFAEDTLRELLDSYRQFHELDVSGFDLVISNSYPAWMVEHDNHLVHVSRRHRVLSATAPDALRNTDRGRNIIRQLRPHIDTPSDLLAAARGVIDDLDANDPLGALPGPLARWLIHTLDQWALARSRLLASSTERVASDADWLPQNRTIMVTRPETNVPVQRSTPSAHTSFFSTNPHEPGNRLDLVVAAFQQFDDPGAVLRIGGGGPSRSDIESATAGDDRIELLGVLDHDQLADEYASATAVVFAPDSEDAGLVSYEAMRAGTPVITGIDSGGANELIDHGISGMVVEPTPDRLAWAMRHVADNPRVRWQLGLNARRSATSVDWTPLLDEIEELATPATRPQVLVLSTYPIEPMVGGGQRRVRHLLRALARWADVTLLTSSAQITGTRRRRIEPGIDQIEIGRTTAQIRAEDDLYFALDHVPVNDVIAARLAPATPAFTREVDQQLERADAVVCAQPFLMPLIGDIDIPVVHDSQNVEAQLKSQLFAEHGVLGRWLVDQVVTVEAEATKGADLLVACTEADLEDLLSAAGQPEIASMVVDNGVDTAALPMRQPQHIGPARAEVLAAIDRPDTEDRPLGLFIGSWHPPNVEAARLVFEIARLRPDWIFVLAGSHTSEFAGEELPANVSLIAVFAEPMLWPLMASADVALNPMASGGGSNLKVYDYLSVGVPVLTTDIGARGLADARDLVTQVEPTPDALAQALDAVRELGSSSAGADTLARGRVAVEERFDWHLLGERWARAVLDLIDRPRPPERFVTRQDNQPMLADTTPPPSDPVEATMEILGAAARIGEPSPVQTTMDPTVREHLKFAGENRFVGQRLPEHARMKLPKQLLIRIGRALSNEQVNYNEALIDAMEQMATQLHRNDTEIRRLRAELATLRARSNDQEAN